MKKKSLTKLMVLSLAGALSLGSAITVLADTPPEPPSGSSSDTAPGKPPEGNPPDGMPDGGGRPGSSADISWTGATEISASTTETDKTYTSTTADENAVLVDGSSDVTVTLNNPTVDKTGGTSASDNYSFYGINSGVLAKDGVTLNISGGTITTNAAGANGVFSYGANNGKTNATGDGTTINIENTTITTTAQGSGGIMTTYGGTTNAKNLTITTEGGSSAPIRTDRGGGWVTVDGGTYTSNGLGSPAIYSTADVDVSNATLISNKSEGVCIEGTGSIELTNCDLTAINTGLNGNAQFYDTIMIYQSMSGDASSGTSEFTMTGGSLTSKNGHTFHVTNTVSTINLNNVKITNSSDNVLISVCADGWNGGTNSATMNATDQTLNGTVLVGSDSTLNLNLKGSSVFTGNTSGNIVNGKGTTVSTSVGTVNVTLESGCVWVLTADSEVTSLSGTGKINYNGHTLKVGDTTYSSGNIGTVTETSENGSDNTDPDSDEDTVEVYDAVTGGTSEVPVSTVTAGTVYRMYDKNRGEHFYTKSETEMNQLVSLGWVHESGSDFNVIAADEEYAIPVYRLYNSNDGGMHFYTSNAEEVKELITAGWNYEGISFYVYPNDSSKGTSQYRLYNPNSTNGEHNWTTDIAERNDLIAAGWQDEDICWKIA